MADKKLKDLDPLILEALCTWQLLRQLEFSSDDIYIGGDGEKVFVQVQWRGKDFTLKIGDSNLVGDELGALWEEAAEVLKSSSTEELDEAWKKSKALAKSLGILAKLEQLEIYWPKHPKMKAMN